MCRLLQSSFKTFIDDSKCKQPSPNSIITYVHKRPKGAFTNHVDHFLKFSPPMGLREPYYSKYMLTFGTTADPSSDRSTWFVYAP